MSAVDAALGAGEWGPWREAAPIEHSDVRRYLHGAMDEDPVHWDPQVAAHTRYGTPVVPAGYPMHAARRGFGTPDPFDRLAADPDWDGADLGWEAAGLGLPDFPLERTVNAGSELELFAMARVGDVIAERSRYLERGRLEGRSGPMMRVIVETEYADSRGRLLMRLRNTVILR